MKRVLTLAIISMAATTAQAQEEDYAGWTIGAAASFSDYKLDNDAIDDSAVGVKLYGQYRFNRWFGLEGAYLNSGEIEEEFAEGASSFTGDAEVTVDGFTASLVGYVPLQSPDVDLFGKVGYFDFDQELEVAGSVTETRGADGLTAGVGAGLAVSERFGLRVEYDWYNLDDADFWTLNLGAEYRFGGAR